MSRLPPTDFGNTADRLLVALSAAHGAFVPGSRLGKELGVSRTAVWKQVRSLKAEGYLIESRPRQGYRLTGRPDAISRRELAAQFDTRWLGRHLVVLEQVDSTNRYGMEDASLPHGTVVVAGRQSAGRGRLGRSWETPPGTVPFSVVLSPQSPPERLQLITLATAVGMADGIFEATGIDVEIKWPNDLLVGGKKIAGILTEARTDPDRVVRAVVGVGLNIATRKKDFPADVRAHATSLAVASGDSTPLLSVLGQVLGHLERVYDEVLTGGADEISAMLARYRDRCTTIGLAVTVTDRDGQPHTGTAVGVDDNGALLVEGPNGVTTPFYSGDVTLAKASPEAGR